mmetsp:Transcript_31836/g.105537  ORF Transcript_31836/g.105537 Transcript_31836/m.105537 type:complete len:247 (+) Transcript_31836:192-932(+)
MASTRNAESARIASRHRTGSVGALLGREPQRRGRSKPRDYQRENVRAIRRQLQRLRQEREEKAQPAAHESFKLRRFDNIPSRLHRPIPPRGGGSNCYEESPKPRSGFSTIVFTPPSRVAQSAGQKANVATPSTAAGTTPSPAPGTPGRPQMRRAWSASAVGSIDGTGRGPASRPVCREVAYDDDDLEDEYGVTDAAAIERSIAELRLLQLQQPLGLARGGGGGGVPSTSPQGDLSAPLLMRSVGEP